MNVHRRLSFLDEHIRQYNGYHRFSSVLNDSTTILYDLHENVKMYDITTICVSVRWFLNDSTTMISHVHKKKSSIQYVFYVFKSRACATAVGSLEIQFWGHGQLSFRKLPDPVHRGWCATPELSARDQDDGTSEQTPSNGLARDWSRDRCNWSISMHM